MKKLITLLIALMALGGTTKADVEWTIWEGSLNMSNTENGWDNNIPLDVTNFTSLEAGDLIYVYATQNNGTSYVSKSFGTLTGEGWSWGDFSTTISFTDVTNNADFYYTVTSEFITEISAYAFKGVNIRGCNYTASKVVIKKKNTMIKYSITDDDLQFGDWGGYWSKDLPTTVKAGDFFYISATRNTSVSYWQGKFYDGTNNPATWQYNFGGFNHDLWAKIMAEDVTNINANKVTAQAYYYDATGFYFYHPVISFTIGSIGMATFCANVAVNVPDGIEAYYATLNGDRTSVILTKISDGIIPQNTGVIIKGDEGSIVEFTATTTATTYPTNVLQGVTEATTMTAGDYVLYNDNGTAEFCKVTATELAANKAYLPASALAAARLSIVFEDEASGISTVNMEQKSDNRIYNLNGQVVNSLKKGLYIKNGKKYIAK